MTTVHTSAKEAVQATLKARHRREIGDLDYRRGVSVLDQQGLSQTLIAQLLGVKQPTIQRVIVRAKSVPMPEIPRIKDQRDTMKSTKRKLRATMAGLL